jgi:hypothetical protein
MVELQGTMEIVEKCGREELNLHGYYPTGT